MSSGTVQLASISWIDENSVPNVGFWFVAGALMKWPNRVMMGLVGTSNPAPPPTLENTNSFASMKQYRALLGCSFGGQPTSRISNVVVDAGYTPPFNKSKLDTKLRDVAPIPDDPSFYPGESSSLSGIVSGKLHPSSTLSLPRGCDVLLSALIKFRAGQHTDSVGIKDAKSPVHVPWVWCEFALISSASTMQLLCNGSVRGGPGI